MHSIGIGQPKIPSSVSIPNIANGTGIGTRGRRLSSGSIDSLAEDAESEGNESETQSLDSIIPKAFSVVASTQGQAGVLMTPVSTNIASPQQTPPTNMEVDNEKSIKKQNLPYQAVIDALEKLNITKTPVQKLDCLAKAATGILSCVDEFYSDKTQNILMGAEDKFQC